MSASPGPSHPILCHATPNQGIGKSLGLGFTIEEDKAQISEQIYPNWKCPSKHSEERPLMSLMVTGCVFVDPPPPPLMVLSVFPVVLLHSSAEVTYQSLSFCRLISHLCAGAAGPLQTVLWLYRSFQQNS